MYFLNLCDFCNVPVSQGSAVTSLRYGGICNNNFVYILWRVQRWNNFENRVIFREVIDMSRVCLFSDLHSSFVCLWHFLVFRALLTLRFVQTKCTTSLSTVRKSNVFPTQILLSVCFISSHAISLHPTFIIIIIIIRNLYSVTMPLGGYRGIYTWPHRYMLNSDD